MVCMFAICLPIYIKKKKPFLSNHPPPLFSKKNLQDNGILHDEPLTLNTVLSSYTNLCCLSKELVVAS